MPEFSIVIPVYNRPGEVDELLQSLTNQSYKDFEVIIVEDGSQISSENVVIQYKEKLTLKYFTKENSGPGLTRNYGAERSDGEYIVFFDSDCIIPEYYFDVVLTFLKNQPVDAFGGPDREHPSFSDIQKAINYSMTSFFTTGGIRGGKKKVFKYHPRSFNMGFSRKVFQKTGGFSGMRFGEDIDMSLRIEKNGFQSALIPDAYVYHKRRTNFKKFFKQVYNSGIARINLYKLHPESLKILHFFPSFFTLGIFVFILLSFLVSFYFLLPILVFVIAVFADSLLQNREFSVAVLSVIASFIQTTGYGLGFINAFWKRIILKKDQFYRFTKNFYK